jgi:hypothetical protein
LGEEKKKAAGIKNVVIIRLSVCAFFIFFWRFHNGLLKNPEFRRLSSRFRYDR